MVRFIIEDNDEVFSKNFTVMLSVVGLNRDLKKGDIIGYRKHNRTRSLQCDSTKCRPIIMMHLGYLPDTEYLVNASIFGLDHLSYKVKDLLFTWATYNPAFTELELHPRALAHGSPHSFLAANFLREEEKTGKKRTPCRPE